jgi:AraC-like DNA-binding protein
MTTSRSTESAWLSALAFEPPVFARTELYGRWGGRGGCANPGAYLLSQGRAELVVGDRMLRLESGDAVLLLTGARHVVRASCDALVLEAAEVAARVVPTDMGHVYAPHGAPIRAERAVLAALTFGTSAHAGGLRRMLPEVLHLRPRELDRAARSGLEALRAECDRGRQANPDILLRLGEVVCLRALEHAMPAATVWDAVVIAAARSALSTPDARWSVDELAVRAGLSRSRFCERFSACFGEPPMRWLRRQRLELGARWLDSGACSVAEAAERLGYDSEDAFRKAFRRHLGRAARASPGVRTRPG